jgi:hypothetical protein
MATRLAEQAPYWTKLSNDDLRKAGQLMVAGCGDDRWQWGGIQFFGGNYGLSMMRGAAMELQKPGSYIEATSGIAARPLDVLAGLVNQLLVRKNILGLDHEGCAGAKLMQNIALTGINVGGTPEGALEAEIKRAQALAIVQTISGMSEDRFDHVSETLAKVAQHKLRPYDIAKVAMEPTGEDKWQMREGGILIPTADGVPRVPLHEPAHLANLVVVNDDPDHIFNSLAAWEAGSKAYHVSRGRLPEVHGAIETYMGGVSYHHFEDALTVLTAKTTINLPLPGADSTLQPEHVQYLPHVEYAPVG